MILGMQYVTGVETWTQLVYKPEPTFDIRNTIGNWCRAMDQSSQLMYNPGPILSWPKGHEYF